MIIGIPKEIKNQEYRVGATPAMVRAFIENNHTVYVEDNAGDRIGFTNEMYEKAGALIKMSHKEVFLADMIIKVKELQESEFPLLREGQILFCYLHLAPDPVQTKKLMESGVIAIAYETVTDIHGKLPLLVPMSEIAGRLAIQVGASCLQLNYGGKGILLGGIAGVKPAEVLVIGGGAAGTEAARMALGIGANVTIVDKNLNRLRTLDGLFGPSLKTLYSISSNIEESIKTADLVIGAVLIPGKMAPKVITKAMIKEMQKGSVLIDISIDQGGCSETSKPTTHDDPTYIVDGVIHYCVTNMPGACAKTATLALTNATMDDALLIANLGYKKALLQHKDLMNGLNVAFGHVTNRHVAEDLGLEYVLPETLLK